MTCVKIKLAIFPLTISSFPSHQSESNCSIIINICPSSSRCPLRPVWCWILIWLSCASLCYNVSSPAFLSSTGHLIKTALRFSIFLLISNFQSWKSRVIGLHNMRRAYVSQSEFMNNTWILLWRNQPSRQILLSFLLESCSIIHLHSK